MLLIIRNLREIAEHCRKGGVLPADHAQWLADSLNAFLNHGCHSMDEALGLRFARGGVRWWIEEGMRSRDAALRELAARFYPGKSTTAQAVTIRTMARRFAASNWRIDKLRDEMPAHYAGTPKEYLWSAFKSGARMPLGERRLRIILACRQPRRRTPAGDACKDQILIA